MSIAQGQLIAQLQRETIALQRDSLELSRAFTDLQREMRESFARFEQQLLTLPDDDQPHVVTGIDARIVKRKPGRPPRNG